MLAAALGISAPLASGHAAEWTIAPDFRVGSHSNDNARLSEGDDKIKIWGAFADLGGLAQWRSETASVLIRPRLRSSWYPGDEDEESDDQYLDFTARQRGQRADWTLGGNYSRETVIRGELTRVEFDDPDIDSPDLDATGRVDQPSRRTIWRLAPRFSYELTERNTAGVGLSYMDVQYSPQVSGLSDYTDAIIEGFHFYDLSPTSRFRTAVFASRYETDAIDNESTSYGIKGRYEREFTEVYDAYVEVGAQRTELEGGFDNELEDSSNGFLFDAGVRRTWERTEIRLAGGRFLQPSGAGSLRETDQLRLNLRHQFRPRWYGELSGVVLSTDVLDSADDADRRDYYDLRARVGYELSRAWTVEASYARRRQDYKDTPGTASANETYLTVNYQPRGRVWSW